VLEDRTVEVNQQRGRSFSFLLGRLAFGRNPIWRRADGFGSARHVLGMSDFSPNRGSLINRRCARGERRAFTIATRGHKTTPDNISIAVVRPTTIRLQTAPAKTFYDTDGRSTSLISQFHPRRAAPFQASRHRFTRSSTTSSCS
jgi:hypothetical protein